MFAVNGFDMEMGYGGLDRAVGYRLVNLGVRGIQVRHRAMLARLANLCESEAGDRCRPDPPDTVGSVEYRPGTGRA